MWERLWIISKIVIYLQSQREDVYPFSELFKVLKTLCIPSYKYIRMYVRIGAVTQVYVRHWLKFWPEFSRKAPYLLVNLSS